jgi:hypothetical protein
MSDSVQTPSTRRPRREFKTSDMRLFKSLYLEEKLPMWEIALRMNRREDILFRAAQMLDIPRRCPRLCGTRPGRQRRNAKIVEAVLSGDSWDSVARRWGIGERGLYEVLYEHKRRVRMTTEFWRQNFLSRRSALR